MKKILTLCIVSMLLLLGGCIVVEGDCPEPVTTTPAVPQPAGEYFDLFEHDILEMIDKGQITGGQVTVDGVKLGDNFQYAIDKIGYPHFIDEFIDGTVLNAKYENEDKTTKYILHFENNILTRIVIRDTTPGLIGASQTTMNQSDITSRFGKPDFSEDNAGAKVGFRTYYYFPEGLEIYHKRKKMIGYSFVVPQEAPKDLTPKVYNTDYNSPVTP